MRSIDFCQSKRAVLMVEEGQPDYIEQALHKVLRKADIPTKIYGKGELPIGGEYTAAVMAAGVRKFLTAAAPEVLPDHIRAPNDPSILAHDKIKALAEVVPARPPGFCTGCPERPIFAAMKLVEKDLGAASCRGRYRLPFVLDPAAVQYRRDDDGLWPRPGLGVRVQCEGGQALDLDHG